MLSISSASSSTTRWTPSRPGDAAPEQVVEAAGGGDEDVDAAVEGAHLGLDGGAAVHREDAQLRGEAAEVGEVLGDLQAEFAGGAEDEGLDGGAGGIGELQQRQAEGGGLAGAGLGEGDHVAFALDEQGDDLGLDRGGLLEAQLRDALEQFGGKSGFVERRHGGP
ncbi:MAG: hypothetical protein U1F77_10040 [Kiritimatiellia bacterium]